MDPELLNNLPPGVLAFPDASAVARRGAEEFIRVAQHSVAERGTFIVALSGGSTPRMMYEMLAQDEELRAAMPWWQTHFFWGDERHVPPESSDSNYRMAQDALLSHSPAPPTNIHRVQSELEDPTAAARLYDAEIRNTFEQLGRGPTPAFDLLLLGVGTDAHTASLFPGTYALTETSALFVANRVDKLDTIRFTISPTVIAVAQRVMLLVCGADKAVAIHQVFREPFNPEQRPAQLVTQRNGPTIWLLDEAAASQIPVG